MAQSVVGRAAFSAAVALALGIGVREVAASPEASAAFPPYCSDKPECDRICRETYPGQETGGVCNSQNLCYCYFAG